MITRTRKFHEYELTQVSTGEWIVIGHTPDRPSIEMVRYPENQYELARVYLCSATYMPLPVGFKGRIIP